MTMKREKTTFCYIIPDALKIDQRKSDREQQRIKSNWKTITPKQYSKHRNPRMMMIEENVKEKKEPNKSVNEMSFCFTYARVSGNKLLW